MWEFNPHVWQILFYIYYNLIAFYNWWCESLDTKRTVQRKANELYHVTNGLNPIYLLVRNPYLVTIGPYITTFYIHVEFVVTPSPSKFSFRRKNFLECSLFVHSFKYYIKACLLLLNVNKLNTKFVFSWHHIQKKKLEWNYGEFPIG